MVMFLRKIIPCAKACTCFVDQEDIGFFTMASSEIWNSLSLGLVDASFCCFRSITESRCVLPPPLLKPSTSACYLTTGVERKCVDLEKNTYIPEPPLNAFFQGISKYPWNLLWKFDHILVSMRLKLTVTCVLGISICKILIEFMGS